MDIFGEVCIIKEDIELWLDCIKQLSATPSRRAAYAKAYSAELKIKTAKKKRKLAAKAKHLNP